MYEAINQWIRYSTSKITTENTQILKKKYSKSLQVKNLRIMFVSQSNNPLENDEIRTRNNFAQMGITPGTVSTSPSVSLRSYRRVQKDFRTTFFYVKL